MDELEKRARRIEDRYIKGAKIVKKDRKFLAGVLKCSERDVLRFLKRKHLYGRHFYHGERTLGGIARGVGIEMGIVRKPYIGSLFNRQNV